MKIRLIIIFSVLSFLFSAQSKEELYSKLMADKIELLNSSKSVPELKAVISDFKRISTIKKNEYLPLYYAAYGCFKIGNANGEIGSFSEALDLLDSADRIENSDEIKILKARTLFMMIPIDMVKYRGNFKLANQLLNSVIDKNNPRFSLVQAIIFYETPKTFGGDKEKGCVFLNASRSGFKKYKNKLLYPSWGAILAESLKYNCSK